MTPVTRRPYTLLDSGGNRVTGRGRPLSGRKGSLLLLDPKTVS